MKKRLLKSMFAITGLLASTNVVAADYNYDFKVGDIYYNITSKENRTVEVTNSYGGKSACNYSSDYTGDIVFPESVVYNDTTYAVKAIGEFAMCNSYEVNSIVIPASIDSIKAQALRLIFEVDANGKVIANTYKTLPKVIIEYGNSILHYGTHGISADSILINREMKYHQFVEWGNALTQNATYIEFGDSVSVIPSALTYNNTSLKEVKFPNRPFSFDVYNPDFNYLRDGIFSGCTSLEKVDLSNLVPARSYYEWVDYDNGGGYYNELTKLTNAYFIPPMTFKGCTALKEVILPDTVAYLNGVNVVTGVKNHFVGSSAFEGCTALESFKFPGVETATSRIGHRIGNRAFAGSGLKSLELPSFISCLDSEAFADCASLESVKMPTVLNWKKPSDEDRGDYESYPNQNSNGVYYYYLSKNLFANCTALKTVDFGCIKVVIPNTFAGCNIENINLGGVTYLGEGNFASHNLNTFSISSYNTNYKIEDNILKTYDGKQWLLTTGKNYTGATVLKNDTVEVIGSQLFDGLPIESYDLPKVYSIGYRAFANTNLKKAEIKANIKVYDEEYMDTIGYSMSYGAEAFADCKKLEEYSIDSDVTKLPKGIFKNCELLTESPKILETFKTIPADIFYGTGITEFTFGEKVELINESAMPNGTTDITIYASNPPVVIESDEAEYISNVTLVVPSSCVDAYSAHKFWGRAKEVVANSDYEGHGWSGYIEPAPNGLYFAKKDGNICYYDMDKKEVVDTYIPAGAHTFQLASWHGAIYGVNAGDQYYYINDENNTLGDGELYVVNKRETGFSKSTVVNNKNRGDGKNYQAFHDPFHIMIENDSIYYTCRNFSVGGVKVLPAKEVYNTPYMTSDEVPVFAAGHLLPYYNYYYAYATIHAGLQRDSEGVYWHALNYSGNGICRYKQSDIYTTQQQAQSASRTYPKIADGVKLSAMFLDEKNDYIYIFSTLSGYHGVYRARISAVKNGGYELFATSAKKWELIDSSPASAENNTDNEGVYVRQFTSDGNYVYWAYIAEKGSGYKSGIKRVNATGTPKVEYVVEDVEAYGICHYEYDGSRSPSVETKEQTATFAIPRVDNATEYTLNVYYDAEKTQLAKTVHYDETGKIIPMSDYIELTIDGFENGEYYYDVVAKSESGEILNSYTGSFEIEYTGVENISTGNNAVEVARYDIYGKLLLAPTTGVNIVKYSDGTICKEMVK